MKGVLDSIDNDSCGEEKIWPIIFNMSLPYPENNETWLRFVIWTCDFPRLAIS